ncbi:MAG: hypothetical protein M4579_006263 [Chaenotheca gracillima]|nr:MAG: hypothetical protein M4579_006263 [Chaenotheca gracillima]
MSFLWDARTVLTSTVPATSSDQQSDVHKNEAEEPAKLGAVHIWNYLASLSQDKKKSSDHVRLVHFRAASFQRAFGAGPVHLGDGASYSVEKCTIVNQASGGPPLYVAVKRLNVFRDGVGSGQLGPDRRQHAIATVLKEIRILTHLPLRKHPNIVNLIGYSSEFVGGAEGRNTDVSLVMEFAPYGTFKDFCQSRRAENQPLDLLTTTRLMLDVARGLEALHNYGIPHGDVKLENTLIFEGEACAFSARLSDFGHSLLDLDQPEAKVQHYLGTPLLNAPEIRDRSRRRPTTTEAFYQCDVYSYGLLLWELVLSGDRFCTAIPDLLQNRSGEELLETLNALPKDELLLCALRSLSTAHGREQSRISQTLRRLLQATLRDDPDNRKTTFEIVQIFMQQEELKSETTLNEILFDRRSKRGKLPALDLPQLAISPHSSSKPDIPLVVQADLVTQLRDQSQNASSSAEKRSALLDLAMCSLMGFGHEVVDVSGAMLMLEAAARLGSAKALELLCVLRSALPSHEQASIATTSDGLVTDLRTKPGDLDGSRNLVDRLRGLERIYQEEAMSATFDITHKNDLLYSGVIINDVRKCLEGQKELEVEHLECIQTGTTKSGDDTPLQGLLLTVAARLGLLPVVEFLLKLTTPSWPASRKKVLSSGLSAACRGGHADVLTFLLDQEAQPTGWSGIRPTLHWMSFISDQGIGDVFDKLLALRGGKAELQSPVPAPGVDMQHFRLSGTPLEFAIALNNKALVDRFLGARDLAKSLDQQLDSIGWTDSTFRNAVSLNVHEILPQLIPLEVSHRRSRPGFAAKARYNVSQGRPELLAFGLFDLAYPAEPLLAVFIHGRFSQLAVESTIDQIIGSGICSVNDKDEQGYTALYHAVRYAPCHFDTHLITALLARGATFGDGWTPGAILATTAKRRDHATAIIVNLLFDAGLLPLSTQLLFSAVGCDDPSILKAILSFTDSTGNPIDVNQSHTGGVDGAAVEEAPIPVVYYAVSALKSTDTVRVLLDAGADIAAPWNDVSPLKAALQVPNADATTIDLLIERGAPLSIDDFSLVHTAASARGTVDGVHVMFHLLSHPRIEGMKNNLAAIPGSDTTVAPLHLACYTATPGAVRALLQAGVQIPTGTGMAPLLDIAVGTGRRPETSLAWSGDLEDEDAVYEWRLDMEDIILALLSKIEPGHGRSNLHVAAELGNLRRVIELVEHEHMPLYFGDRDKKLPGAYIEDIKMLETLGERESYIENIANVAEYISSKTLEEITKSSDDLDAMERLANDGDSTDLQDPESGEHGFEHMLKRMRLDRDELETSPGDGLASLVEWSLKLTHLVETRTQSFGGAHAVTLRAKNALFENLIFQNRVDEAETIQLEVLQGQQGQLSAVHEDVFDAQMDRVVVLCYKGQLDDALKLSEDVMNLALDTFGLKHAITLEASVKLAGVHATRGNVQRAIRLFQIAGEICEDISRDRLTRDLYQPPAMVPLEDRDIYEPRSEAESGLAMEYLKVGKFEDASKIIKTLDWTLEFARPKNFLQRFMRLVPTLAAVLDMYGRYDDSEPIYKKSLETCLEHSNNGRKSSWCLRTVLKYLSAHYRARGLWEQESNVLQQQLDHMRETMEPLHEEVLEVGSLLIEAFEKQKRWAESAVLREQIMPQLEVLPSEDMAQNIRIRMTQCVTYRHLDDMEASIKWGEEALEICRAALNEEDELALKAGYELGQTLSLAGRTAEAIKLMEHRVTVTSRHYGEIHHKTRYAVETLVSTLMRAEQNDEALEQAKRCVVISRQITETNGHIMSNALHALGVARDNCDQCEEAIEAFALAVEQEKMYCNGELSDSCLTSMRSLARVHTHLKRFAEAENFLRTILDAAPGSGFENEDTHIRLAKVHLSHVCEETGRVDEAIEHCEVALALARQTHGDETTVTTDCRAELVRVLINAGRYQDAKMPAMEVMRTQREKLGEYHADTMQSKMDMCTIYPKLGMWPEAEMLQRSVLRKLDDDGETSVRVCELTDLLAESCRQMTNYEDAVAFANRALDWRVAEHGEESREGFDALINVAYAYADADSYDEAEVATIKALEIAGRADADEGDDSYHRMTTAQCLQAYLYFYQDRMDEAVHLQQQLVQRRPEDLDKLTFMVSIYKDMERYAEAAEVAEKALSLAQAKIEHDQEQKHDEVVDILVDLTKIYTSMEEWQKAKERGERACTTMNQLQVPGVHGDRQLLLRCLRALEPVYEALCDEEKLYELAKKIAAQEDRSEAYNQSYLIGLAHSEHLYNRAKEEKSGGSI